MKQIKIKKTDDMLFYDTLDNGLQVFMVPKEKMNTTFVSLNVKYGAIHNEFTPSDDKKMAKVPNGIAHFLEHKMFEQENGVDPMMFYAEKGADVNAYTSLYNTAYHFSCSSHLNENLEYLLDFVQAPYFTDENIAKEKGIIEEEIKMYNDDPYSFLEEQIRFNAFLNHPIKYSIAGTVRDINSITKEHLYTCYNTFYQPSNMFLVISGKFDPETLLEVIKTNQNKKDFPKKGPIKLKKITEDNKVLKEYEEKVMNVEVPKISYGLKIPLKPIKIEPKKGTLYLAIMLDSLFGSTSTFNEEMKEKGYLLSKILIETFPTESHLLVTINADTEYADELLEAIKNRLLDLSISDEDFENKRKMFISNGIYIYEDVNSINRNITNDLILYNEYYPNIDDILNKLNKKEYEIFKNSIKISNTTTLIIKPKTSEGGYDVKS
ncbi:MAG: pitrilysin family protein [Bacilli bacterium]|nr:pitrilysin family protein [Bacilli bacterium]MDD3304617.1 pitrilysin family protein [Bacilli bacterium]MDD4053530.1 pitrilysin family protein [Bacilli bacterium]MDD4411503.1 pitrilysin family protein [Bacilli bacterium]